MRDSAPPSASQGFDGSEAARRWAQPLVDALSDGFVALYLYGSATSTDFHPARSDVNLLLIASALPASAVRQLAAAWPAPTVAKSPVNLVAITRAQLESSLDTFAMELSDVKSRGRLLAGHDVLEGLRIPPEALRAQIERELRLVTVRLRRTFLNSSQDPQALSTEVHNAIGALAGCARGLAALGMIGPAGNAEGALASMARLGGVEPRPFHEAWRLRHDRGAASQTLFLELLDAVDAVLHRVDRFQAGAR